MDPAEFASDMIASVKVVVVKGAERTGVDGASNGLFFVGEGRVVSCRVPVYCIPAHLFSSVVLLLLVCVCSVFFLVKCLSAAAAATAAVAV